MTIYSNRAGYAAREIEAEMLNWLKGGLDRSDGRLAMFDTFGEPVNKAVIKSAIAAGLAEPWFSSPMRPQWMVCRITAKGRETLNLSARTR
ncbi:MAG: hypothetical protein ABJO36_09745 [Litorimonas sp.]